MYRWNSSEYSSNSSNQKSWGEELLSKIPLTGYEQVLDIGCGDGELTARTAARVPLGAVTGIDSSSEMVGLARERHNTGLFPNLSFVVTDARDLDYKAVFDLVFSNACLHWVIDHLPVLKRISRSLKPGGRIFIQMGGAGNASEFYAAIHKVMARARWREFFRDFPTPYGYYSVEEYRKFLPLAGLREDRIEMLPRTMIFQGTEKFASWIRTTSLPYTHRIPESRREDFISDIVEQYISEQSFKRDGIIRVQMLRLEVEATKSRL